MTWLNGFSDSSRVYPTKSKRTNILARESSAFVLPASEREIRTANQNIGIAEKIWLPSKQEAILLVNADFFGGATPGHRPNSPLITKEH